jgi:hypothetical protein
MSRSTSISASNLGRLARSHSSAGRRPIGRVLRDAIARGTASDGGELRVSWVFGDATYTLLDDVRDGPSPS